MITIGRKSKDLKTYGGIVQINLTEDEIRRAGEEYELNEYGRLLSEVIISKIKTAGKAEEISEDWAVRLGKVKKEFLRDAVVESEEIDLLKLNIAEEVANEVLKKLGYNPLTMEKMVKTN